MFAVLFVLYNLSVSTAMFVSYIGVKDWIFAVSIVEICIGFIIVTVNCVLYALFDYIYFGEFKCFFKWDKFELNYYFIQIGIRIIFGIILGLANSNYISGFIVATGFFLVFLVTIILRPYADLYHSIRSSINLLFGSIIFLLYSINAMNGPSGNTSITAYFGLFIIIFLYLTVIMALSFVVRQYIIEK